LDKVERTPSGGVRLPAVLTRPGVFVYHDAAGNKIREYRPPEEVHKADSVASLGDAPVTIGHPSGGVSVETWSKHSVGHVRADKLAKDELTGGVASTVVVSRKDALAGIERQDSEALRDISAGYSVRIDPTPGVTPAGESYDRVQRDITYNHVALLRRGDGRQGTSVGLRLDSSDSQIHEDPSMKLTLRLDGKDHEVEAGSAEHIALQAKIDSAKDAQILALTTKVEGETKRADEATSALTAAKVRLDALDAATAKATRTALESSAGKVLGAETKFDGKSDQEVKILVCSKADSKFADKVAALPEAKREAYVDARFDIATETLPQDTSRRDSIAAGLLAPVLPPADRSDAAAPTIESDPLAYIASRQDAARSRK
jgi:hypothetical protein